MTYRLGARGGSCLLPVFAAGLAFAAILGAAESADAQAPFRWVGDGYVCSAFDDTCTAGTPCPDDGSVCVSLADDYDVCVPFRTDLLCCEEPSDCPSRPDGATAECVGFSGPGPRRICIYDREDLCLPPEDGTTEAALDACFKIQDADGDYIHTATFAEGDCDGDRVPNGQDACRCAPAETPDGCPDTSADAGTPDAGGGDGGTLIPDSGGPWDSGGGPVDEAGLPGDDATMRADSGSGDGTAFRGDGGCACESAAPVSGSGALWFAALLMPLLGRRRRRRR